MGEKAGPKFSGVRNWQQQKVFRHFVISPFLLQKHQKELAAAFPNVFFAFLPHAKNENKLWPHFLILSGPLSVCSFFELFVQMAANEEGAFLVATDGQLELSGKKDLEDEAEERKRPQFGSRFLTDKDEVFKYNAWDDVQWDEEQQQIADDKVALNSAEPLDAARREDLEVKAADYWDKFYETHQRDFFKDRHWLFTEFTELMALKNQEGLDSEDDVQAEGNGEYIGSNSTFKIYEIGCGVGNTIVPILQMNL